MTAKISTFAGAKINLTLHVTGQRSDGYHLLDSLVVFADIGDRLVLTPDVDMSVQVSGPFARGVPLDSTNLVWRAAELAGWRGSIDLRKDLPHAAGIGSGSSDAAAVLRALEYMGDGLSLGADVPVCMSGRAARMSGIGENIQMATLPKLPAVLVNSGVPVPTGAVFRGLARKDNAGMSETIPVFENVRACVDWIALQRNDLEAPACAAAPEIDTTLDALKATKDVLLTRMSGSGATCFAIYPTMQAAHRAVYDIGTEHSDWWCVATKLS
ncbi:MAG: 4-(cytidine 5'-diphospho)-2-C-methyl-D-erythritol kinase [Paracoccaceae bacterium]